MKVLIVGAGGREHAIGWKISEDYKKAKKAIQLFFSPGNGGTAEIGENISISGLSDLVTFAEKEKIDFTIVGPEAELADGIVDIFEGKNLKILGPNKKAAQLESSKAFAKEFMQKHGVKTAKYKTFKGPELAKEYLKEQNFPIVVKASGLAAGKGVLICQSLKEGIEAVNHIMKDMAFGDAGAEVVIEEFLTGFEASILSVFNGKEITSFISAMDHKKIGENDTGLNTGGMGVLAPNPNFTDANQKAFEKDILTPTLNGLLTDDLIFSGVIFFGLMINESGMYLLEYNLRMGDPETQATLPLLKSDLLDVFMKAENNETLKLDWQEGNSCCVVMASGGYPNQYEKGYEISGLENLNAPYFIAGAKKSGGKLYTSGGRVLGVVGTGKTREDANKKAYENIKKIHFDYEYYRSDIGKTN